MLDATGGLLTADADTCPRAVVLKPVNETDPVTDALGGRCRTEAPLGCVDTLGCLRHGQYKWTQTGAVLSLVVTEGQEQRCPRPSPGLLLPSVTTAVLSEGCRDQGSGTL